MSKRVLVTGASTALAAPPRKHWRAVATRFSLPCTIRKRRTASMRRLCASRALRLSSSISAAMPRSTMPSSKCWQALGARTCSSTTRELPRPELPRRFTADQAKVVFNTNVVGLLRTNRATLPTMRTQGGGLIINIGSILGGVTFPFFGVMSALTPVRAFYDAVARGDVTRILSILHPNLAWTEAEGAAEVGKIIRRRWSRSF
jgi:short chain dehydrogenase